MIEVGQIAPDFTLRAHDGSDVSLGSFRGEKMVVLSLFPAAFTGGWTNQTSSLHRSIDRFEAKEAQVLGLSSDPVPSLRAWATTLGGIKYPILSDFHPQGAVLSQYGLLNEQSGTARRSAVVIDKQGVVKWVSAYEPGVVPTPDELLAVLDAISWSWKY